MHECPICGQACDCDGEDLWHSWPYTADCIHDCEEDELFQDDYFAGQGDDPDYFHNERTPTMPLIFNDHPVHTSPTVPLYPPPTEIANLAAEIALRLQTDPGLINALRIATLDVPGNDIAIEAALAATYVLLCAAAGYHPTLSIVNVAEGRQQQIPDGKNCAICGDNDHQAFECHHTVDATESHP